MKIVKYAVLALLVSLSTDAMALYRCTFKWTVSYQSSPCDLQSKQEFFSKKKLGKTQTYEGFKFEKGFVVSHISVEKEPTVTDGQQWIAYEITVTNNTSSDRNIALKYQGVDNSGYVFKEVYAVGTIPAHSSKTFKDHTSVPLADLDSIKKWVLEY